MAITQGAGGFLLISTSCSEGLFSKHRFAAPVLLDPGVGEDRVVELLPGDTINIPAHRKHRVEWTSPDEPTVWLAFFYGGGMRSRIDAAAEL